MNKQLVLGVLGFASAGAVVPAIAGAQGVGNSDGSTDRPTRSVATEVKLQQPQVLEVHNDGSPLIDSITGEVLEYSNTKMPAQTSESSVFQVPIEINPILAPDNASLPSKSLSPAAIGGTSTRNSITAQALCFGSWYRPRGYQLYPQTSDPKKVYFDPTGNWQDGHEVRRILGMECFGDNANWNVPGSNVFKSSGATTDYGRQILMNDGQVYEGCYWLSPNNSYNCDFKIDGPPSKLASNLGTGYWWQVLKNWSYYQGQILIDCGGNLVGSWVGSSNMTDIAISCIEAGPYTP